MSHSEKNYGHNPAATPLLTVTDLTKQYGGCEKAALTNLSFTLYPGQILGLLGPNGAGKTTAISLISTLLRPSSGAMRLAGYDYSGSIKDIRRLIGFIPQDIALYPKLSARENLDYFASLSFLPARKRRQRIDRALAFSQLENRADHRVETFSGGMKRRLNMAVALLHQPRLLLLDEPTVGIDAQSRQLILDGLQELAQKGTALIYTSHYMDEIEQLCQRVLILDHGRIIDSGAPRELTAQHQCPNLGELYLLLTGRDLREQ